ncbi:MAG: hypothetical protein R3258_00755 [Acidimicrobiia bacterium]|nr:hypothetical protein [Acidimicrobiia bacterium]
MAVNLDPKPGRWILPLVILGMIAFTYFFVRELPAAAPDTTRAASPTTTTTVGSSTTTTPVVVDPAVVAYLDEIDEINDELKILETEMITVNDGFDADPRTIQYGDAETRLDAIVTATGALSDRFDALTPPDLLIVNHDLLKTAMDLAEAAAQNTLDGLRSTDTGEQRRAGREGFVLAVADFAQEVANAHNVAEGTS